MSTMNPQIDNYLAVGCGRCPLVGTPECKVHSFPEELVKLRAILLDSGLTEELKWSMPCYTFEGKNIVLMSAFKEYCSLSFFKGALLKDEAGILVAQTENVQAARLVRFTSAAQVTELEAVLKAYIREAIEVEKAGLKIEPRKTSEFDMPDELLAKFDEDPAFQQAFEALTPGRQRGYLLHFAQPKQSQTRTSRIEKAMPKIFEGKGHFDR